MALRDIAFSWTSVPVYEEELRNRIESWIRIRFLLAYLLFGTLFLYRPSLNLPYPVAPLLGTLLLILIFNSLSQVLLLYRSQMITWLAYAQVGIDFTIVTLVYQITGGIDSPFAWLYLYVILVAGLVGGYRLSLALAVFSLASSGFVLWAQYYFLLPHFQVGNLATHSLTGFHNTKLINSEIISNGAMFLSLGVVSGYIGDLAEKRRLRAVGALSLLKEQKEKLLHAITITQENERKRIARELHDQTGQTLTVLISSLKLVENKLAPEEEVRKQLSSLGELAENLLDEVRDIIFDLRPSILDDLGVIASLQWYVRTYIEPLGIKVKTSVSGESKRLSEEKEVLLYRFLQEALSNVIKHAQATEVKVSFEFLPEAIKVEVKDNGIGFEVPTFGGDSQRWGLVGIKERIDLMQGGFSIRSERGQGTCLSVVIPEEA